MQRTIMVGLDETATTINVTWTSVINPAITVTNAYTVTGVAANYDGSGLIIMGQTFAFNAGTGTGGTLTYTAGNGAVLTGSLDNGVTYTPLGASPLTVAHLATLLVRSTAASGYVNSDGTTVKQYGPYTGA